MLNIQKPKIMAAGPIISWEIDGETVETVSDFILGGSKITVDGDCSHGIKRCFLLGRKPMTNLDSELKNRDITLPTKVCIVKAMVFPGFPGSSVSRESTCNAGDMGSIPGLGRYPGGGHGNPLQCSCLESAHGQRSLAGYSPWGRKGSDMTERLSTHSFSSSHVWM